MFATAFNTVIALIEGRFQVAREFLRSPQANFQGQRFPVLETRLQNALEKFARKRLMSELQELQRASLRIEVPSGVSETEEGIFFMGVDQAIQLVEERFESLVKSAAEESEYLDRQAS